MPAASPLEFPGIRGQWFGDVLIAAEPCHLTCGRPPVEQVNVMTKQSIPAFGRIVKRACEMAYLLI